VSTTTAGQEGKEISKRATLKLVSGKSHPQSALVFDEFASTRPQTAPASKAGKKQAEHKPMDSFQQQKHGVALPKARQVRKPAQQPVQPASDLQGRIRSRELVLFFGTVVPQTRGGSRAVCRHRHL